jgi:predicted CDP-diglyceride synthetase/phosphatidate cytidylyltransferase
MIFVKYISLMVSKDSINESPVSDAPTTTILVLFYTLVELNYFLVNIDNENGVSS